MSWLFKDDGGRPGDANVDSCLFGLNSTASGRSGEEFLDRGRVGEGDIGGSVLFKDNADTP